MTLDCIGGEFLLFSQNFSEEGFDSVGLNKQHLTVAQFVVFQAARSISRNCQSGALVSAIQISSCHHQVPSPLPLGRWKLSKDLIWEIKLSRNNNSFRCLIRT
jgi:hypothetical protein